MRVEHIGDATLYLGDFNAACERLSLINSQPKLFPEPKLKQQKFAL